MNYWRFIFCLLFLLLTNKKAVLSQCCSGGSGSPVAGGTSQGVLKNNQLEFNLNHQYISSNKFMGADTIAPNFLEKYSSHYLYFRTAFGVSEKLTLSIESGYFVNKTEYSLDYIDTISSSGIADLVIFPRYNFYNKLGDNSRTEITIGVGLKIPLGSYNDSILYYSNPQSNIYLYQKKPPAVQPTTGSNDFIFYGFFYKDYFHRRFRLFANSLYILKGWNPNGERFGDYASLSIFAGKTFFDNLGVNLQLKGEYIGKMKRIPDLPYPNFDITSTGSKKLLFGPQISYTIGYNLTAYVLGEIPLYQYVNGTQIASQYYIVSGLTYRFTGKEKANN